ncbi:b-cell receptor-associated protein 31-like domain-containing protein [Ditylenchus destructor]|uniref:Endoplasmic reticulum transmembrane protein n=1 Tax=Ditylenchus destructor TaxID=166010 RepID=A0AAD4R1D4_9BILA|nr:b-cell receptor-associated protein 31-like domain-containing protein [Ditylenchus destructor]
MTLQWTVVAFILYAEIGTVLILLLPWVRPSIWKKFFNSRFVARVKSFSKIYSYAVITVLLLLFFDATREVRKYADADNAVDTRRLAEADAIVHMRLFRAQRNLYISGFALLLFLVINRIVGLLYRSAHLEAAAEAAMKQAEGASKAAKTLMESESSAPKDDGEKKDLQKKLEKAMKDRDAMKAQAENLQEEYDRVCDKLNKLESSGGDKKGD